MRATVTSEMKKQQVCAGTRTGKGEKIMQKTRCVICGKEFYGMGNNPDPTSLIGRCCNKCNVNIVVPARFDRMNAGKPARIADERSAKA